MKARKKGQCCHKEEIGNKTFFCVEPTGHQCAHFYFVTIEDLQFVLARAEKAEAENAALREALIDVLASLVAAHSLLEGGGKKAAASDKMFYQMLKDYAASIARGRAALLAGKEKIEK